MRNYKHLERYLNELNDAIYEQPEDTGHTRWAQGVVDRWMSGLPDCHSVLDVGAGQGFCQPMFERWGASYEGIALGNDVLAAFNAGRNIKRMDFNFLEYDDESFDLVFSRHSLEHSFSPLYSLLEWYRVSKQWLGLVVPAPEHFGFGGRNHYYVLFYDQWKNLLQKAGWHVIWEHMTTENDDKPIEYCFMCEKIKRVNYK